jgi:hypothetical protein
MRTLQRHHSSAKIDSTEHISLKLGECLVPSYRAQHFSPEISPLPQNVSRVRAHYLVQLGARPSVEEVRLIQGRSERIFVTTIQELQRPEGGC